ncbi:MAG: FAD-binding oxidoreductase [Desulfomonilaceae bacterium]|nr:FAD-binding oxidoreductase [Desulfomonilaceae bacterium]
MQDPPPGFYYVSAGKAIDFLTVARNNCIQMGISRAERKTYRSFDGSHEEACWVERPDRYRAVESCGGDECRIVRGGGYSYAAAGFGGGARVQDLSSFNRVVGFRPSEKTIEVEAGISLGSLFHFLIARGFWLPVIPGYPGITVGGCIAANVHGKNPFLHGTFRRVLKSLLLYHPDRGFVNVSRDDERDIFDLTVGGYGLTGTIVSAELALETLQGNAVRIERCPVRSLQDAVSELTKRAGSSEFAYSFHPAYPVRGTVGNGWVYAADLIHTPGHEGRQRSMPKHVDPWRGRFLPFSIWGPGRTPYLLKAFSALERRRPRVETKSLFDGTFPFVGSWAYFSLYAKPGLFESQLIVPYENIPLFLTEIERILVEDNPPSVMISLKLFSGRNRLLSFENDGLCFTIDLCRNSSALRFLSKLDALMLKTGAIPNIVKDSRLTAETTASCYPEYELMKQRLADFDPRRLYRSELSIRLGL